MTQPASASFPPSDNHILLIRELKMHVDTFSDHLQKILHNHNLALQAAFLKEFSQNVTALNRFFQSIPLDEMHTDLKAILEETLSILTRILHLSIDTLKGTHMTLLESIKNYSLPSTRESDLCAFLSSLGKYSEAVQILIQELHLLSQDLSKCL
jgi:hypothetical protein